MDVTYSVAFPQLINIMNYREKTVHPLVSLISGGVAGAVESVATVNPTRRPRNKSSLTNFHSVSLRIRQNKRPTPKHLQL